MYEELVTWMRYCANDNPICEKMKLCPFYDKSEENSHYYLCGERMLKKAADAIEDLQKQLDNAEIENIKLKEEFAKYRGKNRWISVRERLPKICKNVLVTDGIYVGMGWYDIYKRHDTGITDKYWCTPNCDVDSDHVKYWAEMPEPPKNEGE